MATRGQNWSPKAKIGPNWPQNQFLKMFLDLYLKSRPGFKISLKLINFEEIDDFGPPKAKIGPKRPKLAPKRTFLMFLDLYLTMIWNRVQKLFRFIVCV